MMNTAATVRWYWIGVCLYLLFLLCAGQSDEDDMEEMSWQLHQDDRLNLTSDSYTGTTTLYVNTTANLRLLVIVRLATNCLLGSTWICLPASWTWEQDTLTLFGPSQTGTKLIHYLSSSNTVRIHLSRLSQLRRHQYWIQVTAVQLSDPYTCDIVMNSETEDGAGSNPVPCRFQNEGHWNYHEGILAYVGSDIDHSGSLIVRLPFNTASNRRLLEFLYSPKESELLLSAFVACPYVGHDVDVVLDVNLVIKCTDTWSLISFESSGIGYIAVKRITIYAFVDGTRERTTTEGNFVRPATESASTSDLTTVTEYLPTTVRITSTESASADNQSGPSGGLVAAVTVSVIVILIVLLILGFVFWFRRRKTSGENGPSIKLDEGHNAMRNNSYTNPGEAASNNTPNDPPIYNEIAEGEYNVLFEGKEDTHTGCDTPNERSFSSSCIQSVGCQVTDVPKHGSEVIDTPHQDKIIPAADDDYQIPQTTLDGKLYQPLKSPSALDRSRQTDLKDSDEAYDTLQRKPDGKYAKPSQTVTGLDNYQILDLPQNRDIKDIYETADMTEPDHSKTTVGSPQGNDYETPGSSAIEHQGPEDPEKRADPYDTLQHKPRVQRISTSSPADVNASDDYETPVTNAGSSTYQTLSSSRPTLDASSDTSVYHHLQRPLQQLSPRVSLDGAQQDNRDYGMLDLPEPEDGADRGETHDYVVLEKSPSGQTPDEDPEYFVLDNSSPDAIDL